MHVKHRLACSRPVCQEEVHGLAACDGSSQCLGHPLPQREHRRPIFVLQGFERRGVLPGHHQDMPRDDRPDVHEGHDPVVLVDYAGGLPPVNNPAEDTGPIRLQLRQFPFCWTALDAEDVTACQ